MKAFRAAVLRFDDQGRAVYDQDGLLVLGDDGLWRIAGLENKIPMMYSVKAVKQQ